MKTFFLLVCFVLLLVIAVPTCLAREAVADIRNKLRAARPLDHAAMLRALREKETGNDPAARGPRDERTAYGFMPATWRIYTQAAWATAGADPAHADRVAATHLRRRSLPVEPAFVAAAWHYGPWFQLAAVRSDYAREVTNLYAVFAQVAP